MFKIKKFTDYTVTKIEKGWSGDEKYLCQLGEEKLLLKVADIGKYEMKKSEFVVFTQLELAEITTNLPFDFGVDDLEEKVWLALTWVDGVDLRDKIAHFSVEQQYEFGLEAGKILRKIHELPIPEPTATWQERFGMKLDSKLKAYDECELKYQNGELFVKWIEESRQLLADRPQCFHHGDFHDGNFILTVDQKIVPIDFNRFDYGDPWEEFNRIVWSKDNSPAFASGQVDGYFDGVVPEEFWHLLALYISSNTLSSLPWAIPFGEGEIQVMRRQAAQNLADYEDFTTIIPKWYQLKG